MRNESDWLSDTVKMFAEYESPPRFYYWSCLAAVSAILKDNVYFDKYLYQLYPNIYVLLYGPSAIKKGPPIALAKSIVTRVNNTRVINGRASAEAIIKELGTAQQGPGKPIFDDSCAFISSSELSSALISSDSAFSIMTDLADRIYNDEEWTHRTKGDGSITLKNPTLTWLAGTNEALFKDFMPEKNIRGGLIGRTYIIAEHKSDVINSLMFPPNVLPDRDKVANGIKHITNLRGAFYMSNPVRKLFDDWYHEFKTKVVPGLEDDTGTLGRTDDNILKLAMLISSARRGDKEITKADIREAITEVVALYNSMKKITSVAKLADSDFPEKVSLFLHHLANCDGGEDSQVNILRKFTLKMNHEDVDKIVTLLERQQVLNVVRKDKDTHFKLRIDDARVEEYLKHYKK